MRGPEDELGRALLRHRLRANRLDLGVEKRVIEKSGAWFAYAGERLGQGRENAKQFLKENPDIRQIIEDRVRKELGLVREPEVAAV